MTNKREEYLDEFILKCYQNNSLSDLMNNLTRVVEKNKNSYEDFVLYITGELFAEITLEVYGISDKTDIEEEEKKRRLQRFKLYQELKEEFGQ